MRVGRSAVLVFVAAGIGVGAACGLDVTGTLTTSEGGALDSGGTPPGIDASQACDGSACGLVVPPGWAVVTFGPRSASCAGGAMPTDVVENPAADAGACTCGTCQVLSPPSCSTGTIGTSFDTTSMPFCLVPGFYSYDANGG